MKLYYSKGACSLVVRIVINELNLKCDYESVDLKAKQTETEKDFLNINPKGAVPTLELDNSEILTENAVILQYLADKNHASELLPPVSDFKRYHVLEWTNYATTELHKTLGLMFNPMFSDDAKAVIIQLIKKKLDFVNNNLQNSKYLLGDSFTIADAYVFVMLTWLKLFKLNIYDWSNLARYFAEISERAAVQKSLQEEKLEVIPVN